MKDLKFGWGNENTHDTCHWGISPFTVLQVSTDQQTKRCKTQEWADLATYLSTDDVRALEVEPGCCPASYHGMLNLLKRYICLFTVLFGAGCSYLTEVQGVYQVLAEKIAVYKTMSAELIAETLWRASRSTIPVASPHKLSQGKRRKLMEPAPWMRFHPFVATLEQWASGVSALCGEPWSEAAIRAAI
jgi:hypothetical protein